MAAKHELSESAVRKLWYGKPGKAIAGTLQGIFHPNRRLGAMGLIVAQGAFAFRRLKPAKGKHHVAKANPP